MIKLKLVLLLAQACNASYCDRDPRARAAILDAAALVEDAYLFGANDAHALICHSDATEALPAQRILAFTGTEFSEGEIPSIMSNVKAWPFDLGGGHEVDSGYWEQLQSILPVLPPDFDLTAITGHSMGGCVAHLYANTHWKGPALPVVSFGAPKCANAPFWADAGNQPLRYVHGRDFAPVWPYLPDEWEQPGAQMWLHDGPDGAMVCEPNLHRPVMPDSIADHAITAYIAALAAAGGA
jgi:hypothetical protein